MHKTLDPGKEKSPGFFGGFAFHLTVSCAASAQTQGEN
jgi:hypothetical protein